MKSLLLEMEDCTSVKQCIELAITDAYGDDEQATAWLTCIQEMFDGFKTVRVLGEEVQLEGFDLINNSVLAICKKGKKQALVALQSVEFPKATRIQKLWLKAWQNFASGFG